MGLKYRVSIGLNNFEFKDGMTSLGIAELLANNFVPEEYNKGLAVKITIEKSNAETEEETKDDNDE